MDVVVAEGVLGSVREESIACAYLHMQHPNVVVHSCAESSSMLEESCRVRVETLHGKETPRKESKDRVVRHIRMHKQRACCE